jgi:hypothetical protein
MMHLVFSLLLAAQQPAQAPAVPAQSPPQQQPQEPTADTPNAPAPETRDRRSMETAAHAPAATITGRIAAEGNKPLPDNAFVQGFCNGVGGPGEFTRDRFRIQLGSSYSGNAPPGLTNTTSGLAGCEVRVQLSGYLPASTPVSASGGVGTDIGVILLRPRDDVSGYTYSYTSALAPPEARKAYEKGLQLSAKNKLSSARKELERAIGLYPKYAVGYYELGTVLHREGDAAAARRNYEQAVELDPQFLRPLLQLAIMASSGRRWTEVEQLTGRILARNRFEFPQAFLYHAVAKYNLKEPEAAEKSALRAIELDAPHRLPKAFHLLSVIQADREDYPAAAANLRLYLKYAPDDPDAPKLKLWLIDLETRTRAKPAPQRFQMTTEGR